MERYLPLDHISPNPEQPRTDFNPEELASLAASMRASTQILNITVEVDPEKPGHYLIIDGERRWRAAHLAGMTTIRATILPYNTQRRNRLTMALVANLQRADLNPIEEARAYRQLQESGMSDTDICLSLGINSNRLTARLAWLALDPAIQQLVADARIPADRRIAKSILALPESHRIKFALGLAARPGLTIKAILNAAERLQVRLAEPPASGSKSAGSPAMRRVAEPAPQRYTALAAVGRLPPWADFTQSIRETCQACALYEVASPNTCQDCPVIALLNLILGTQGE